MSVARLTVVGALLGASLFVLPTIALSREAIHHS